MGNTAENGLRRSEGNGEKTVFILLAEIKEMPEDQQLSLLSQQLEKSGVNLDDAVAAYQEFYNDEELDSNALLEEVIDTMDQLLGETGFSDVEDLFLAALNAFASAFLKLDA